MNPSRSRFLTAEWRFLAMLNYEVDPAVLKSRIPVGTELDYWQGKVYVSVVGFLFTNTKLLGFHIPFHSTFEEVNLRFYVRRLAPEGWRRGVVFIKELVPRRAIAWTARAFYNENYSAVPMTHAWQIDLQRAMRHICYGWTLHGWQCSIKVFTEGESRETKAESHEEFITEHYWGYARQRDGGTVEYQVEHPRWRVWTAREATLDCNVERLYGKDFAAPLRNSPVSALLVDGSPVSVMKGRRL
jgi:hypothetical protein